MFTHHVFKDNQSIFGGSVWLVPNLLSSVSSNVKWLLTSLSRHLTGMEVNATESKSLGAVAPNEKYINKINI